MMIFFLNMKIKTIILILIYKIAFRPSTKGMERAGKGREGQESLGRREKRWKDLACLFWVFFPSCWKLQEKERTRKGK